MKNKITSICALICIVAFIFFFKGMASNEHNMRIVAGMIAVSSGVVTLVNLMDDDDNEDDYNYHVL